MTVDLATILDELHTIHDEMRALRFDTATIREAVLGLRDRVACLERAQDKGLLTPLPPLSESWESDRGDRGREP